MTTPVAFSGTLSATLLTDYQTKTYALNDLLATLETAVAGESNAIKNAVLAVHQKCWDIGSAAENDLGQSAGTFLKPPSGGTTKGRPS